MGVAIPTKTRLIIHHTTHHHHHTMSTKKTVVHNPYLPKLGKALRAVSFIAFGVSIAASAAFYNTVSSEYLASKGFVSSYWLYGCLAACLVFSFCVAIFGVKYPLRFFFIEKHAARTKRARSSNPEMMPTLRSIALVCAAAFILFESYAAFNGGGITAKIFIPKVEGLTNSILSLEGQKQQALTPLNAKVLEIEAAIEVDIKAKTDGLKKLLKEGNSWAKNEYATIAATASKAYAKELKAANDAYAKENERWGALITTAAKTDGKKISAEIDDAEGQKSFLGNMFKIAALLSLFLGIAMEYALAANDVVAMLPTLTDAEALAIEMHMEQTRNSGFVAAAVGAIKGFANRSEQAGGRAPQQPDPNAGKGLF